MHFEKLHAKGRRGGTFLIIGKLHEEKNRVPYIGCWVKLIIQLVQYYDWGHYQNQGKINIKYALISSIKKLEKNYILCIEGN